MREYARRYRARNRERIRARERELYAIDPEKYREKSRRVRAKRSPEYAKELRRVQYCKHNEGEKQNPTYQKAWRKKNAQKLLEYQRAYAENNREYIRNRNKRYRQNNVEKVRFITRKAKLARRAREAGATGTFTQKQINLLRKNQRGKCYWCKRAYGKRPHLDHVWPLAKGGSNGAENLVLSCRTCNVRKNAKTPMEWAGVLL